MLTFSWQARSSRYLRFRRMYRGAFGDDWKTPRTFSHGRVTLNLKSGPSSILPIGSKSAAMLPKRAIADTVLPAAAAMDYRKQIVRARAHRAGDTEYRKTLEYLQSERDQDFRMALLGDEELHAFAAKSLEVMEIPSDRLPVVERGGRACETSPGRSSRGAAI